MLGFILHLIKIMPISDGLIYAIEPLTMLAIAGGVKAAVGGIQALSAGKKEKEKEYTRPEEVDLIAKRALENEQTGMPEPSRMMAMQNAQQAAIFGMRAAQDRRVGIANIGQIQAGLNRTYLDIAARDSEIRQRNFQLTQQALGALARAKDLEFSTRHSAWMNREQQRRANIGAGLQNVMGGLDLIGAGAAMGAFGGGGKTPKTFNPNNKFLNGEIPKIFNEPYTPSASSMTLYRGGQPTLGSLRTSTPESSPSAQYQLSPASLSLYRGVQPFSGVSLMGGNTAPSSPIPSYGAPVSPVSALSSQIFNNLIYR